ncbi:DUF2239 family protein [Novosphingobium humi]|nr:DUF2239 family protein [Novosphingobium humi]WJS97778.1 DUF2239 family protein [Novosphingobium humi]
MDDWDGADFAGQRSLHLALLVSGQSLTSALLLMFCLHGAAQAARIILPGYIDSHHESNHLGLMNDTPSDHPLAMPCTAFMGSEKLASGDLADVALAVNARMAAAPSTILIFDDTTGAQIDIDLRGTTAQIISRLATYQGHQPEARKRGGPSWAWSRARLRFCRAIGTGWRSSRAAPRKHCGV